ncbi:MAG TPA: hypothetical protein VJ376_17455, partial [Pseudomonadota bacterium]|nr:hypothetical protein [Pseudomonadota bacterium]
SGVSNVLSPESTVGVTFSTSGDFPAHFAAASRHLKRLHLFQNTPYLLQPLLYRGAYRAFNDQEAV